MASTKPSHADGAPIPESLFSRLIIGPVLFVSFLVSLLMVDRKTYSTIFGAGHKDSHGYYHSHQRKLARTEMDEAFQQRSKVIAGMCMLSGIVLAIVMWAISLAWWYLRQIYP